MPCRHGHVLFGVGDDEAQRHAVGLAPIEPSLTMPPMRKALPFGASPAATWVGEKKNTRLLWKALSTSAATAPRMTSPADDQRRRL